MSLRTKIKNALDEARILVLGAQVLLGFQYRAFFEPRFAKLPRLHQELELAGLLLLLAVILLVMLPAARHRIVERGRDTSSLHRFTMNAVTWALVPFALALVRSKVPPCELVTKKLLKSVGFVPSFVFVAFPPSRMSIRRPVFGVKSAMAVPVAPLMLRASTTTCKRIAPLEIAKPSAYSSSWRPTPSPSCTGLTKRWAIRIVSADCSSAFRSAAACNLFHPCGFVVD